MTTEAGLRSLMMKSPPTRFIGNSRSVMATEQLRIGLGGSLRRLNILRLNSSVKFLDLVLTLTWPPA
ncbi:hypothetical protein THIOM_001952 [Candidatus Thiomargarita nelsonii]|uniref:Uncharacterized protein n=1 Tax=Candidatus Thiomargarita nelsonii TaxID=1003181 RepID=A0A176S2H8_9GAMM|nr:hypothetical protein THIOM_001952 [Candidatus Thiomargarita nelsonii]